MDEQFPTSVRYAIDEFDVPSRLDVAQSYLRAELPNIAKGIDVDASIDALSVKETWRMLEALSKSYRMNGVFRSITDTSVDWRHVELPIGAISLTGIKPHINDIVYSDEIMNDPRRFADYLHDYFDQYPDANEDPLVLNEFRPRGSEIDPSISTLLTIEREDQMDILDGTHRLIAMAMLGRTSICAFAGIKSNEGRGYMIGDSTFLTMRLQYEAAETDEEREAIVMTTVLLCKASTDGWSAVKEYWIEHPRDDEIKRVGRQILRRLS